MDITHTVCGGLAFRYTERPTPGDRIDATKARLLDGTVPTNGDLIVCGSCGQVVHHPDLVPVRGW